SHVPPQFRSDSRPLISPSSQVASTQRLMVLVTAAQMPLRQSSPSLHFRSSLHAGHSPPQSTSVSEPFCSLSVQPGSTHRLLTHAPLEQFSSLVHFEPLSQSSQ